MNRRRRVHDAALWGVVGSLAFLVGHGAYLLAGGTFLGVGPVAGLTLVVFVGGSLGADGVRRWVAESLERRDGDGDA